MKKLHSRADHIMRATWTDLSRRSKELFRATDRNETVEIFYRGKFVAVLVSPELALEKHPGTRPSAFDHPLFGYCKDDTEPVQDKVRRLRQPRFDSNGRRVKKGAI